MMPRPPAFVAALALPLLAAPLRSQTLERVSLDSNGVEANDVSVGAVLSADGRFVAFHSPASNLVAGDTNGLEDVYVYDRVRRVVERVSVDSSGLEGNGASLNASISSDGRYVVFESFATNLIFTDTNNRKDVFLHDRKTHVTTRVSEGPLGVQGDGFSEQGRISADARFVAFHSRATNFVAGDTNGTFDVFVRDLQSGGIERVSVDSSGAQASAASELASISGDGDVVTFRSLAANLVSGDTNGTFDVFVRQRAAGTTTRVSVDSSGAQSSGSCDHPAISADGSTVVFESDASDLVAGDTNGVTDIFRHVIATGVTTRVSVDTAGNQADDACLLPSINADGTRIVFHSEATNLVANDTNANFDAFYRDELSGLTERLSVDSSGAEGAGSSGAASINANGRFVSFASNSSTLVALDGNGVTDVFVRDRCDPVVMNYCTAGTTANGCTATMSSTGIPSASLATPFVINVNGVEGNKQGLIFYGVTGRLELPWFGGTSYRCAQQPVQRTPNQLSGGTDGACDGTMTLDWNQYVTTHPSATGVPFAVGMIVDAQCWFRDPPSPGATSLSDGLEFCITP